MDPVRSPAERLELDLGRTVDRLRSMGVARLDAGFEPEASRADAARELAQRLADVAADLAGEPRRELPVLATFAVGDQLAVCGRDLVNAAREHGPDPAADAELVTAADALLDLRRRV